MTIALLSDEDQWMLLSRDAIGINWIRINSADEKVEADAFIILEQINNPLPPDVDKPVLLHSVTTTLLSMQVPGNIIRINGWKGFLSRPVWEVSGTMNDELKKIFAALNKQYIEVKDEPGFIAARIIAMIINEAYFALGEKVSTKEEIDIAMKLGTNYPLGPFEWAAMIGIKHIYDLLLVLSREDKIYLPAPLLQNEALA